MIRMIIFCAVLIGIVIALVLIVANILVGIVIMKRWRGLELKFDDDDDDENGNGKLNKLKRSGNE